LLLQAAAACECRLQSATPISEDTSPSQPLHQRNHYLIPYRLIYNPEHTIAAKKRRASLEKTAVCRPHGAAQKLQTESARIHMHCSHNYCGVRLLLRVATHRQHRKRDLFGSVWCLLTIRAQGQVSSAQVWRRSIGNRVRQARQANGGSQRIHQPRPLRPITESASPATQRWPGANNGRCDDSTDGTVVHAARAAAGASALRRDALRVSPPTRVCAAMMGR